MPRKETMGASVTGGTAHARSQIDQRIKQPVLSKLFFEAKFLGKWARGCLTKGGFKMIFLGGVFAGGFSGSLGPAQHTKQCCESSSAQSDPSEPIIFKPPLVKHPLVPFPSSIRISSGLRVAHAGSCDSFYARQSML